MELFACLEYLWKILDALSIEEILKVFFIVLCIAAIWPITQAYLKVYDITIINQLDESCQFYFRKAYCGDTQMTGCQRIIIQSLNTHHIQVVPSWRGMIGSYTVHMCVTKDERKSVDIPIFNSGDIQRSRTFLIQGTGVREYSFPVADTLVWCADHKYGQTS